jgi:TRAP-type mannitol/chloroaromatic compound transport system permease small subunit
VAYCRNTGQFALVEFKVDMRVSGALVPTVEVVCRRYGFYQTRDDWLRLTLEIVVTCSTVAYTYFLVLKIINDAKEEGRYFAFFDSDWNCVDFLHCLFLLLVIALWLYIVNDPSIRSLEITENSIRMGGKVVSFAQSATAFETYFTLNGINMLLGLCRCMKFLRMNGHLGQLTDTLALMKEGIVQFMFIFLLSVVTFMCVGQMLFGHQVLMFSDPLFALDSVLGFVVGTSDTGSLYETSTVSAVIFEGPFVLTMIFFILPLTIAIIMDGYSEMQASQEHDPHSRLHELVNIGVFEQAYRGVTRSMQYFVKDKPNHPQLRFPDLPTLLQLMSEFDDTPVISYSDFRKRLKHRNIPEGLLIDILEKYDAFQHDPQWQYLEMENQEEIDAANEANAGTAPVQLAELLDDMEDRVERVLTDLTYANGKLDLLINMFTT